MAERIVLPSSLFLTVVFLSCSRRSTFDARSSARSTAAYRSLSLWRITIVSFLAKFSANSTLKPFLPFFSSAETTQRPEIISRPYLPSASNAFSMCCLIGSVKSNCLPTILRFIFSPYVLRFLIIIAYKVLF